MVHRELVSRARTQSAGLLARGARVGLPVILTLACGGQDRGLAGAAKVQRALDEVVPVAGARELGPKAPAAHEPEEKAPATVAAARSEKPRVYGKTRFVWIRERPDWASQWVGYLWFGGSVPLKTGKPVYAFGCDPAWYEVEPRGFVCVDGRHATIDEKDPQYRMVAAKTPDYSKPSPHEYAESLGSPRYAKLPTKEQIRSREPDLAAYLSVLDAIASGKLRYPMWEGVDHREATELAPELTDLPAELQIARWDSQRRSTVAHLGEFRHSDRSYLLTADLAWVPKVRTRPYAPISFHGVHLQDDVALPLAFFRAHDRPAYAKTGSGHFAAEAGFAFPRLSFVPLTGKRAAEDGVGYLETKLRGLWVRAADAVVPTQATSVPWGVGAPGAEPRNARATWIEASVEGGWLVAYEGLRPVYVTLTAPGRGGPSASVDAALERAGTPMGSFAVNGKFLTATMDGPGGISHSDVPWIMNFTGPYAIHSAYWHDAWGERVSGGCLNVSPEDGKWLFEYTEPKLPPGWHGIRWSPGREPATAVVVRR